MVARLTRFRGASRRVARPACIAILAVMCAGTMAPPALAEDAPGIMPGLTAAEEAELAIRARGTYWKLPLKEKIAAFLSGFARKQGINATGWIAPSVRQHKLFESWIVPKNPRAERGRQLLARASYVHLRSTVGERGPAGETDKARAARLIAKYRFLEIRIGRSGYSRGDMALPSVMWRQELEVNGHEAYAIGSAQVHHVPLGTPMVPGAYSIAAIVNWKRGPYRLRVRVVRHVPSPGTSTTEAATKAVAPQWQALLRKEAMPLAEALDTAMGGEPRAPVIFLPGIAGTALNYGKGPAKSMELWPAVSIGGWFRDQGHLGKMNESDPGKARVFPGKILREHRSVDFYGGLMLHLKNSGYEEGRNFVTFPYDWRQSNETHLERLDRLVDELRDRTGSKKVALVAHSMGGVISRKYLTTSERRAKVKSLITIGTPYWGSPKAFYAMAAGYDFGNLRARDPLMKILAQLMPSAYELLPRVPFILDTSNGRMLSRSESLKIRYPGFTGAINDASFTDLIRIYVPLLAGAPKWSPNPGRVANADRFYEPLGSRDRPTPIAGPGLEHYVIIGYGVQTLDGFRMKRLKTTGQKFWELKLYLSKLSDIDGLWLGSGERIVLTPAFFDGDGTVPRWSARFKGATATYHIAHNKPGTASHGSLCQNPVIQKIVTDILKGNPPDSGKFAHPHKGIYNIPAINFTNEEYHWVDFTLGCSARLLIVDEKTSERVGVDGENRLFEEGGGAFIIMPHGEYASVPNADRTYRAEVTGTDDGQFGLAVRVSGARGLTEFVYADVKVTKGTRAVVKVDAAAVTGTTLPRLTVTDVRGKKTTVEPELVRSVGRADGPKVAKPPVDKPGGDTPPAGGDPANLGMSLATATKENAKRLGVMWTPGVLVLEVKADSAASRAGLAAGDIIVYADGTQTDTLEALKATLAKAKSKGKAQLMVMREHRVLRPEVTFGR